MPNGKRKRFMHLSVRELAVWRLDRRNLTRSDYCYIGAR
jgi:hypothetical protein